MSASFATLGDELSPLGRHPGTGGYRRFALTPESRQLREWFVAHGSALGLDLAEDRMGNQRAELAGPGEPTDLLPGQDASR